MLSAGFITKVAHKHVDDRMVETPAESLAVKSAIQAQLFKVLYESIGTYGEGGADGPLLLPAAEVPAAGAEENVVFWVDVIYCGTVCDIEGSQVLTGRKKGRCCVCTAVSNKSRAAAAPGRLRTGDDMERLHNVAVLLKEARAKCARAVAGSAEHASLLHVVSRLESAMYDDLGFAVETNCALLCAPSWRLPFTLRHDFLASHPVDILHVFDLGLKRRLLHELLDAVAAHGGLSALDRLDAQVRLH